VRKPCDVLVYPGGTEIGLEIQRALCQCKNMRLHSAGLDVSNHAPYVFSRHYIMPSIGDPTWLATLNQILVTHGIDFIYPAHDDVLVALARNATQIEARIVSSPPDTCLISRSKSQTYKLFEGVLPVPRLYSSWEMVKEYPVFVKPDKGQGSHGAHIADSAETLFHLMTRDKSSIVMEYLPGDEYTVDCFTDRERGLLFCQGRQRVRTKAGISMNSRAVDDTAFRKYAEVIAERLPCHGAWFFQLKKDKNGTYMLLEVGPRLAGTMAFHRVKGVNFALLSIYEQKSLPVRIQTNKIDIQIDRALINRYKHDATYSSVYVDLDDTLLINNKVNTALVRFLYQCVNREVRIVLLTRHAQDVEQSLRRFRLWGLFDEIKHIGALSRKSDFIKDRDAIIIDDSFSERQEVYGSLGILTFDCSMLEMLIDDRE
jgi:carbamoyl-phosphate synthase large subunit